MGFMNNLAGKLPKAPQTPMDSAYSPLPPGMSSSKNPYNPDWNNVGLSEGAANIMNMNPDYQSGAKFAVGSPDSIETMRGEYFGEGPTKWGSAQVDRQRLDEADLRNLAMGDVGSARGASESALAMRGGMSGGARERLAGNMAGLQANRMQDISRAGMGKRADIGISDEAMKGAGRNWVGGQDVNRGQFNANLLTNDLWRQNQWNQNEAGMGMDAYAGEQMANAIGAGGGGTDPLNPQTWMPTSMGDLTGGGMSPDIYGYDHLGIPDEAQWAINPVGKGANEGTKQLTNLATGGGRW